MTAYIPHDIHPWHPVQERLNRSSVSTDDTDTETEPHEAAAAPEIREGREGGSLNGNGLWYKKNVGILSYGGFHKWGFAQMDGL